MTKSLLKRMARHVSATGRTRSGSTTREHVSFPDLNFSLEDDTNKCPNSNEEQNGAQITTTRRIMARRAMIAVDARIYVGSTLRRRQSSLSEEGDLASSLEREVDTYANQKGDPPSGDDIATQRKKMPRRTSAAGGRTYPGSKLRGYAASLSDLKASLERDKSKSPIAKGDHNGEHTIKKRRGVARRMACRASATATGRTNSCSVSRENSSLSDLAALLEGNGDKSCSPKIIPVNGEHTTARRTKMTRGRASATRKSYYGNIWRRQSSLSDLEVSLESDLDKEPSLKKGD